MNSEEKKELIRYLRLSDYRDGEYFLLEEYEELKSIVKRNKIAQYLEELRYQYLKGIISEEKYKSECIKKLELTKE